MDDAKGRQASERASKQKLPTSLYKSDYMRREAKEGLMLSRNRTGWLVGRLAGACDSSVSLLEVPKRQSAAASDANERAGGDGPFLFIAARTEA